MIAIILYLRFTVSLISGTVTLQLVCDDAGACRSREGALDTKPLSLQINNIVLLVDPVVR